MTKDKAIEVKQQNAIVNPSNDIKIGQKVAKQLVQLVKKHKWVANIQGNDYLQVEAWQTVGKFYGMTAKTTESKFVEYGKAKGFEAKAEILNKDGEIIGGATAICLDDEKNWKNKPLYQLKSMAQTRAVSKAYRLILSWVVVLAGYQPTPAEEMTEVDQDQDPDWIKQDQKQSKGISDKQRRAIKMLQSKGKIDPKIKTTGMSMKKASQLISEVWGNKK